MKGMFKSPINVGIIGTGRISDLHVIEYINNPNTEIIAVCDKNGNRAEQKIKKWKLKNVKIYSDYNEILKNDEIDLIEILVPHHLHLEVTLEAIKKKKVISLQKPMCLSISEANNLISETKKHNALVKIFETFIFYPPVLKAKELVDNGEIGTPLSIRIKSNPGFSSTAWDIPEDASDWRQNLKESGGGPLVFDDGHHKFALAWFFMGQAEEIHAWINHTKTSDNFIFDAPSIISFKFSEQRIGNLEIVYSPNLKIMTKHYAQDDRIELTDTEGVLWINHGHGSLGETPPLVLYKDGQYKYWNNIQRGWEHSFINSTRHFIDCLLSDKKPLLSCEQGKEILQMSLAAEISSKDGVSIKISDSRLN